MLVSDFVEFEWNDMTQYVRRVGDHFELYDADRDIECHFDYTPVGGKRELHCWPSRVRARPSSGDPSAMTHEVWYSVCEAALEAYVAHVILADLPKGGYPSTADTIVGSHSEV